MNRTHPLLVPVLTCVLLGIGGSRGAMAQQDQLDHDLDRAKVLYGEGRFDEAITSLRIVIAHLEELRDLEQGNGQLADAHLLLGLVHLAMRQDSEGLEQFRMVVALDPARRLDPDVFAPRVVALFDRARAEAARPVPNELGSPSPSPDPPTGEPASPAVMSPNPPLNAGTRIRLALREPRGFVKGNLVSMNDAFVTILDTENQQSISVRRDAVARVDVFRNRHRHYLAGGIIGAALGATIGALETPGCEGNDGDCYTRGENITYGSLGLGMIGALIGALYTTEEWTELPLHGYATARVSKGRAPRVELTFVVASWR